MYKNNNKMTKANNKMTNIYTKIKIKLKTSKSKTSKINNTYYNNSIYKNTKITPPGNLIETPIIIRCKCLICVLFVRFLFVFPPPPPSSSSSCDLFSVILHVW